MKLYYNPVSSYSQKVTMALFEKNIAFTPSIVNLMDPAGRAEYEKVYPIGKVPVLETDKGELLTESSVIIEYLEQQFPNNGPRLLPEDKTAALQVRRWDRFCDNYLNEPMQKIFFDGMRPADKRDALGVQQAQGMLTKACTVLEAHLGSKTWITGDAFTMADLSAAPALFYLKRVQPFDAFKNVTAYAGRLFERPSFVRALKEAEPILKQMMG